VMEFGLEVQVPTVKQTSSKVDDLPVVTLTRDGTSYLNDKPVNINLLGQEIRRRFGSPKAVYLRADKGTTWDPMAQVISALTEAKLQVSVVTQPEDEAAKRR
jgi:biopolymer transport protein ExbD